MIRDTSQTILVIPRRFLNPLSLPLLFLKLSQLSFPYFRKTPQFRDHNLLIIGHWLWTHSRRAYSRWPTGPRCAHGERGGRVLLPSLTFACSRTRSIRFAPFFFFFFFYCLVFCFFLFPVLIPIFEAPDASRRNLTRDSYALILIRKCVRRDKMENIIVKINKVYALFQRANVCFSEIRVRDIYTLMLKYV